MATKRKTFGQLSKRSQHRLVIAGERYGLTRQEAYRAYNKGEWNPFARGDALKRVPKEFREYAEERTGGTVGIDWHQAAYDNYFRLLGPGNSVKGETYKFNRYTVLDNAYRASEEIARIMALSTEDDLRGLASPQPDANGNPPPIEHFQSVLPFTGFSVDRDLGYRDSGGSWNNIFWYH